MDNSLSRLEEEIKKLDLEIASDLLGVEDVRRVEDLKVKYLGKKGPIQGLMRVLKDVSPADRPQAGKFINDLKEKTEQALQSLYDRLILVEENEKISKEAIDVTLPGRQNFLGRKHPIQQMFDRMVEVLISMGFSVQYGPDIESDYYNFESLNYPKDHPARDMQDTFYITPELLLRTHTTGIQVRVMESTKPPIRIVCPGTVYRNEEVTARSHVFFHQLDALYVDVGVTFSDLIVTLEQFFLKLFGEEVKTRFRPSYFPFVEPGMEVDICCMLCKGSGCPICKHTGWLEVLGAGMVHPEVLRGCGVDPEVYSGFAWGMGVERLVIIQKAINDIRLFTENDIRFLSQFP